MLSCLMVPSEARAPNAHRTIAVIIIRWLVTQSVIARAHMNDVHESANVNTEATPHSNTNVPLIFCPSRSGFNT